MQKRTDPITLTHEKLFFHTFDLLENTFCALAKNVPPKLASPCAPPPSQVVVPAALPALGIGMVFSLEGLLAAQVEPSRVGVIGGGAHTPYGDFLTTHFLLLRAAAAGAIADLLPALLRQSSGWRRLSLVHSHSRLPRRGAAQKWSTVARRLHAAGLMCRRDFYLTLRTCARDMQILTWKRALDTLAFGRPSHAPALLFTVHHHRALDAKRPPNGAIQLVFLHKPTFYSPLFFSPFNSRRGYGCLAPVDPCSKGHQ